MYYHAVNSLTLIVLFLIPSISYSGGPIHGAKAAGMNTAFIAVADDPSAILHNPAGIVQFKGTNIYGGISFLFPATRFESQTGEKEESKFQVFYPPHFYVTSDIGMENTTFGLGVHAPFGIGGRKWDSSGVTRFLSVENFMGTLTINPTLAWKIFPSLSLAAGIDYMGALSVADIRINQSALGAGDAKQEMDSLGFRWGYNLGILYILNEQLSFGIAYRSEIKIDQEGETRITNIAPALQPLFGGSSFKTDLDTSVTFPEIVGLGIAYRPSSKLTIAFDSEWLGWSSFNRTTFDFQNEVPAAGFTDVTTSLDWKDVWTYKFGIDYIINEKLSVRAGYAYIETPVPTHTLNPANPDSDQHNFSIGAGYRKNEWTIDTFYNAGFFKDRKVNNKILNGEYENFIHYAGFSVGYRL